MSKDRIYSFHLGEWNATIIQDEVFGATAAGFFNVPSFVVIRQFQYYYPGTDFGVSQNVLLLRNQNQVVLIDTGSGGKLMERMRMIGIVPADVTAVFITHAHGDHISGLLDESQNATFPNARVYIHRLEDAFWRQTAEQVAEQAPLVPVDFVVNPTTMSYRNVVKAYAGKIQLLNDLETPIGGITAIPTRGHTPGHTAYLVQSRSMKLMVVGDTFISRTTTIQNPAWNIVTDTNRTLAIQTRYSLMDQLSDDRTMTLAYHVTFPGLGFIVRDGPVFDWSTVVRIDG